MGSNLFFNSLNTIFCGNASESNNDGFAKVYENPQDIRRFFFTFPIRLSETAWDRGVQENSVLLYGYL